MFARILTAHVSLDKLDSVVANLKTQFALKQKQLAGKQQECKGSYLLIDRVSGRLKTISLWETMEGAQASRAHIDQAREEATLAKVIGTLEPPRVEVFEVIKPFQ